MLSGVGEAGRRVERTLAGFRRRAMAVHGVRSALVGLAASSLIFLLASWWIGPVAPTAVAWATWVVVAGAAIAAWAWCFRPAWLLRGTGVTRLLGSTDPALASMARSAVQLAARPSGAEALIAAHLDQVDRRLAELSPQRIVPLGQLRDRTTVAGALVVGMVAVALLGSDRAGSGAFALLHPEARDDGGTRIARVVAEAQAEVRFPAYMSRDPIVITSPRIEAPRGATVVWTMRSRVEIADARLDILDQRVRLRPSGGTWSGSFVVREEGAITLHVRDLEGRELRDATQRALVVVPDDAPQVALLAPSEDPLVELDERLVFLFEASDDVGIATLELVIETATGETVRRPLAENVGVRVTDRVQWSAGELGAQPGDVLHAHIEAADTDDVSGPNVGRSVVRHVTVASEATRRMRGIAELEEALDLGVHALADRLELSVEQETNAARERYERVNGSTLRFAEALSDVRDVPVDDSVLVEMGRRMRRKATAETRAHGRALAPVARRSALDEDLVSQLEEDVLTLSDMVGQSRLQDAAALARELESLRREMTSLLAELRRTESPEARRALLAAMMRARARMAELAQRIAAMGEDVPQEFLNTDALETESSESALDSFRDAVERDDLDAAERHLLELEREIDSLVRSLQGADEAFGEARFGPRERAMAEAMDRLQGLETEQRQLAERSERLRRDVATRALDAANEDVQRAARAVAQRATAARERLGDIPSGAMGPMDEEAYDRARQRLVDARDALESGDLGEARRMVEAAREDSAALARDLEISALMFPGRDGRVADAARAAQEAAEQIRELQNELDDAIPRLSDFVQREQREQLRGDAPRQGAAVRAADELREIFASEPDGAPLSPDGAMTMESAREAMQRARQALDQGRPIDAAREQSEAARQLGELLDEMEQQQRQQNGGGEGGEGQRAENRARIEIPGERGSGASDLRQKLLDAMRNRAPRGYEQNVRRYYEELLR